MPHAKLLGARQLATGRQFRMPLRDGRAILGMEEFAEEPFARALQHLCRIPEHAQALGIHQPQAARA